MSFPIAIVGGGISGLATAWYLEQRLGDQIAIDLFESDVKLGGKVQTEQRAQGMTVELGPDSILCRPESPIAQLIDSLGLSEEVIEPSVRQFSIQRGGELYSVPLGMLQPYPRNIQDIWNCSLLSVFGKLVASIKPFFTTRLLRRSKEERSIATAMRSKYGIEISKCFYETVFGGIHSGDSDKLSFSALYPHLDNPSSVRSSNAKFLSFRSGCGALPQALQAALQYTTFLKGSPVHSIRFQDNYRVMVESREYQAVVVATPSYAAAEMLSVYPALSQSLQQIPHRGSAVVSIAVDRGDVTRQPNGSGYLLTAQEDGPITGCTYSSEKWEGRAPDDVLLLRVFFGRGGGASTKSDEELTALAVAEVRQKLGCSAPPIFAECRRWKFGLPQYELGHFDRLAAIEEEKKSFPALFLTGTSYRGVGIPDCIAQARTAATQVEAFCLSKINKQPLRDKEQYGEAVCA